MINLIGSLSGANRLIEPKLMISPSGNANTSVRTNSLTVARKPSSSETVTVRNISYCCFTRES